ncbi:MAG TPA: alpha/beta hydrolase [Jiangellaceae bacterium]
MRACEPIAEGHVNRDGVSLGYQVFGDSEPTILLLPTWTVVHSRFWKLQVPYLARHYRVITYDGPGNGLSDRPLEAAPYHHSAQVAYSRAVLDATDTSRAVVVGLSMAANWALELAATHPDRVAGLVAICPSVALPAGRTARSDHFGPLDPLPDLSPSAVPAGGRDPATHWAKYNLDYWRKHHEDFLWFFFGQALNEPHSTKPIEDAVGWGLETSGEVLVAHHGPGSYPDEATVRHWCEQVSAPALVMHGDIDQVSPFARGRLLAELIDAQLVVLEGSGHLPLARDPVRVNRALREFVDRLT